MSDFGTKIRKARQEKEMSLREAARQLGISAAYLSKIEIGRCTPNDPLMKKISKLVELDLAELKTLAASNSTNSLYSLERCLDRAEIRAFQSFYRVAKEHQLSIHQAVQVFTDALGKQN
jgi:transcriptional regulator with XRE-family HTH domain